MEGCQLLNRIVDSPFEEARECYILGADDVFFGDAHASVEELEMFGKFDEAVIQIRMEQLVNIKSLIDFLAKNATTIVQMKQRMPSVLIKGDT